MKHARQKIREAVSAILAPIGIDVHRSRVTQLVTLPAISLFARDEVSEPESRDGIGGTVRYSRGLELVIELSAEGVSGVDDTVDDYVAQIEAAMASDTTLTSTAVESVLVRTSFEDNGEADRQIMVARMVYRVWYRTTAANPETSIV